jgi:hypothetical protein
MTLSDYHKRREEKIERFKELAQKNAIKSDQLCNNSSGLLSAIPMGQPILVGHHSERGHRRLLERADNMMRKACEADDKAKHYARQAAVTASNPAISSDDPDAIDALKEKLQNLKDSHISMVQGNKIVKSKKLSADQKIEELVKLGLEESKAKDKLKPDCMGDIGFPGYALTNSSANIRRIEERIKQLEKQRSEVTTEQQIGNIQIVNSVEENRIMIYFPSVPSEKIRTRLKSDGFRWSPKNGAWQSYRSAAYRIPGLMKFFNEEKTEQPQ